MPYIIRDIQNMDESHIVYSRGFEPEIPRTPWLSSMLRTGRSSFDFPGTRMEMTSEMKEGIPSQLKIEEIPKEGVPDVIHAGSGPVVHQRVKDKLEELESGKHEFFPLRLVRLDSNKELDGYYLVYISQKPDIIDHDNTLYGADAVTGGREAFNRNFLFTNIYQSGKPINSFQHLINFKSGGYEGLHLWRGTVGAEELHFKIEAGRYPGNFAYDDILSSRLFVSDEFGDFLINEDIRGWQLMKVIEEPTSWYWDRK